jgi:hypothetical protein
MNKAFTYDWRLWTPAELSEGMREAGFKDVRVYWEGTGADGKGNGAFRPCQRPKVEQAGSLTSSARLSAGSVLHRRHQQHVVVSGGAKLTLDLRHEVRVLGRPDTGSEGTTTM